MNREVSTAKAREMPPKGARAGIFPTFFMAGFECSTFIWKDGERKDYVAQTGHDQHLEQDYARVMDLGMGVVREAIRWHLVDRGDGEYDWSTVEPVLHAARECHITPIWDLCHYGFPDGEDPLNETCLERFVGYCREAARVVCNGSPGPHFYTPVNEITFLSGAATDMGWVHPYAKGRYEEMKIALCRMAIEGAKAIREVDPEARMIHVDPLIHAIPAQSDLADEAWKEAYDTAYEAWDMLYGKLRPELGGTPEILDIVGVNVYSFSQAIMKEDGSRAALGPRDPQRKPLSEMLMYGWERYHRPMIIGETSGYQDKRASWLRDTVEECMKAMVSGVDLQGICLYPCVDIQDWNTGEWAKIGLYDLDHTLERQPCQEYIEELRRWERTLDRPESIDPDGVGDGLGRVDLTEISGFAKKWAREHSVQPVQSGVKQAA